MKRCDHCRMKGAITATATNPCARYIAAIAARPASALNILFCGARFAPNSPRRCAIWAPDGGGSTAQF